ncbi:MAG: ferrous iron transport protein B [candidate division KSB1 bacterium]|nr:ferrous iron transport protein B [candidate division KSB1 bacterium]
MPFQTRNNDFDSRHPHPVIVLAGQPNCGKSTIFNHVAGYLSITTNFPGVTVEYLRSHVVVAGRTCNLVDLPGVYSLTALDPASIETKKYLLEKRVDVIVNVVDASVLSRSLELTLQLLELGRPMVLCLNMMDEAERKGISIDVAKLSQLLGIPVIPAVATRGTGLEELFAAAFELIQNPQSAPPQKLSRHVESKVEELIAESGDHFSSAPSSRLVVIKQLEDDSYFAQKYPADAEWRRRLAQVRQELGEEHGETSAAVIAMERHHWAMKIFEQVAQVTPRRRTGLDYLDDLTTHPIVGYGLMTLLLFAFFVAVFRLGAWVEGPLLRFLAKFSQAVIAWSGLSGTAETIAVGALQGFTGGVAVVLPYLFPFLLAMAFIEDIGYLPRIAFLMDGLMHRMGLHGTAVVPTILGYGCSVPAVMAARILPSARDRFIASVIAVLVPCSARMVVIMGLVGYYLGGAAAFAVYLLNAGVVILTGAALSRLMPEDSPGLVLEMPSFRLPKLKVLLAKTWLRLKEFILIAWPLLIVGSALLTGIELLGGTPFINRLTAPLMKLLGLPESIGMTLLFGVLRKELTLLMLFQALGTQNVAAVMSPSQILTFTLFVVFYLPCMATLGIMAAELGWKRTAAGAGVSFIIAVLIALAARIVTGLIF